MIEILKESFGCVVGVKITGKLTHPEYQDLIEHLERVIKQEGKLRLVFEINQYQTSDPMVILDDLKFNLKHYKHIERLAFIGEAVWQEWLSKISNIFMKAEVKYFHLDQADKAWAWVLEGA